MEPTATASRTRPRRRRTTPRSRAALLQAWSSERTAARAARACGDITGEWSHLERAHIVSQPMASPHVRTHIAMLTAGLRRRDRREALGQLAGIVLAAPGSLSGRYPLGNTGAASVSAFTPMPVPEDLRAIVEDSDTPEPTR